MVAWDVHTPCVYCLRIHCVRGIDGKNTRNFCDETPSIARGPHEGCATTYLCLRETPARDFFIVFKVCSSSSRTDLLCVVVVARHSLRGLGVGVVVFAPTIQRDRETDRDSFTLVFWHQCIADRVYFFSDGTLIDILLTVLRSVCPRIYVIHLARHHQLSRRTLDRVARARHTDAPRPDTSRTLQHHDNVRHHHRFRIGRPRQREVRREDAKARATLDRGSRRRRIRARARAGQGTSRCETSIARVIGEWLRK